MLIEQYIFITVFISAFVFFIYIHIAYPFWVHMPVSHTYDVHHKFYNFAIPLLQEYPYRNKWVSKKEVKTISYHESTDAIKDIVIDQLICNYIPSDSILFAIEKKHLNILLGGHFDTPFITTFHGAITDKPLGCICSYPVFILYRQEKTTANFMVFLACDRENPIKKEITRKLIATHEYNCRNRETTVKLSILKKHNGNCAGVKPLLAFSTYLFYVGILPKRPTTIIQVYKANWMLIYEIIDLFPKLCEFSAYMDVAAMKARVDAGQMWIFCLKVASGANRHIFAAYFIEDAMMLYEKVNDYGGKTLNLAASLCNSKKNHGLFIRGFIDCLALIQNGNRDYTMLLMDDVGHNKILAKQMQKEMSSVKTSGAYYMINGFVKENVDVDRALMLI